MSLFGTLQQQSNALRVAQMGLQVTGNNVANANTPGYLRQELIQSTAPPTRIGNLLLGGGVEALGIVQRVDQALAKRLRDASGQLTGATAIQNAYQDVERLLGALDDNNFDTQLSQFNNSLHDLFNRPQDAGLRELTILRGNQLADNLRQTYERANDAWEQADGSVRTAAADINRLTDKIAKLNLKIVDIEGGRTLGSDATGLRDERLLALNELGSIVDLTVQEQTGGGVNVFVGGDYLVADGYAREVIATPINDSASSGYQLKIKQTGAPLDIKGGTIGGAAVARDEIYGKFMQDLDNLAKNLAQSFNLIHSQGQGVRGFSDVTSSVKLTDSTAALAQAGVDYPPQDGTFDIQIYDKNGGLLRTERLNVAVRSAGGPMGIDDVIDQIDAIDGLTAELTDDGELRIRATSTEVQFAFSNDTSGFLAGIGINTFFTGTTATTLEVNQVIVGSPELLAVSSGGIGENADNLAQMVDAFDRSDARIGSSIRDLYSRLSSQVSQDVNVQKAVTSGLESYHAALESDYLAASGVNIDEEAIKMISYQRAFQASAKVIATISELLDTLVRL